MYDSALALYLQHQEGKQKRAIDKQKEIKEEANLVRAGRPSMAAAMGNMAQLMHFEEVDGDAGEDSAQERSRKRREKRRRENASRKSQVLRGAFEPLVKVMCMQVRCLLCS